MKKRYFLGILIMLFTLLCGGVLCACTQEQEHVHDFKDGTVFLYPTCISGGAMTVVCECGEKKMKDIPALGHDFTDPVVTQDATCLQEGEKTLHCSRCGETTKERFSGTHIKKFMPAQEPTCLSVGYNSHYVCIVCGEKLSEYEEIPARGHSNKILNVEVLEEVTCTKSGKKKGNCFDCWEKIEVEIPALGHDFKVRETCAATCFHAGEEKRVCGLCGETEWETLSPILSHEYQNGRCVACGRRDWTTAQIDDPDLYAGDYAFNGFASIQHGAQLQTLYREIETDARAFHVSGETSATLELGEYDYAELGLNMDEAASVWKAFMDDHPLYYWLARSLTAGDKLLIKIDEEYKNGNTRSELNALIYETAQTWREAAPENAYLAALCYHDKILNAVDYAYDENRNPQEEIWAHNIAGVFEETGAVCEGYARSFQLLLNASGIENIFVTGTSEGIAHAWNLVKLDDNKWYQFDLTYNDMPYSAEGKGYVYFAVSANQNVNYEWTGLGFPDAEKIPFSNNHTVSNGSGVNYMPALPAIASTPYAGRGETLKTVFSLGEFTYAIDGFRTVRLILCTASGDVSVPETVLWQGTEYTVDSLGGYRDGMFCDVLSVFESHSIGTLYIPKTVKTIIDGAHRGYMKEFRVAEENPSYRSVHGVLYTKSLRTLIFYPLLSEESALVLPDETVQTAHTAFYPNWLEENTALKIIVFGKQFRRFGVMNTGGGWDNSYNICLGTEGFIFALFPNLKYVIFQNDNYYIKDGLMYSQRYDGTLCLYGGLASLTEITVPAEVSEIASDAFQYHRLLERVVFEEDSMLKEIGQSAFSYCEALTEITLPQGLEIIRNFAFCACDSMTQFVLPSSLKELERCVFWGSTITKVIFTGSQEEWNAIKKDPEWDDNSGKKVALQIVPPQTEGVPADNSL